MQRTNKPAIKLNEATVYNSLRHWFLRATDEQHEDGLEWYDAARVTVVGIATQAGVSIVAAAAVVAALSPRMVWSRNVTMALEVCLNPNNDRQDVFAINLEKARRILAGEEPTLVLRGNKVRAFYQNILGNSFEVTVDGWMAQAVGLSSNHRLTDNQYALIANGIRQVATEFNVTPAQAQAIIWCSIRGSGK